MNTFFLRSWTLTLLGLLTFCITLPHARGIPETWTSSGPMNSDRVHHTATLLTNGKVLVAGGKSGESGGTYLTSAEIYDTATGIWTSTGSMNGFRGNHTATLLANGKVLVAGGTDNGGLNRLASAELYDPATGVWTNTGSMSSARYLHSATLLPNGRVLLAGGLDTSSYLASAELYDTTTGAWISTGSMNSSRGVHTATLLANGKVLVTGGTGQGSNTLSTAEIYDPVTRIWTNTDLMSSKRTNHTATSLANGKVLVAGGHDAVSGITSSAELYDSVTDSWAITGPMNSKRWFHRSIRLANGKVIVAGGGTPTSVELYDPATGIWTVTGAMIVTERSGFEATLLADGRMLAVGGQTNTALASAELYDPGAMLSLSETTHGAITGNTSPYSFNTSATLSATPSPGYLFTGWTGDVIGTENTLILLMDSDKTITANFAPDTNDNDDDGLTNYQEIVELGTNPALKDTDGDEVKDGDDAFPLNISEWLDTDGDGIGDNADTDDDGDGLSDDDEIHIHGTNPRRADSDGDGLSDSAELQTHLTNPNLADTDNDGLSDGAEVNTHGTLPRVADTDGDGFLDGYEFYTGKSPLDINDKPALLAEARTAIEFTFPSALGKTYRIEDSLDLATWKTVESGIAGNGAVIQRFYSTRNLLKRYFRVEADPP